MVETMQHLITVSDLSNDFLAKVFARAKEFKYMRQHSNRLMWDQLHGLLRNRLLITDFFQPSTRTRFSFEAAMSYLGGMVIGSENAAEFSSFKKGESITDNFRVISGYCDVIVGRFLNPGDAAIAASASLVPVINGGDGKGEHPTQALLDLFAIIEKFPDDKAEDLTICFLGDNLHSRTVQSLARLLARFAAVRRMTFVGLEGQNYTIDDSDGFLHSLRDIALQHDRPDGTLGFLCTDKMTEAIARESDIIYVTRSQTEYHEGFFDPESLNNVRLTQALADMMPEHGVILHPLPRNSELPVEVDVNPRSYYFQQAHYGLFIRMALLETLCLNLN